MVQTKTTETINKNLLIKYNNSMHNNILNTYLNNKSKLINYNNNNNKFLHPNCNNKIIVHIIII